MRSQLIATDQAIALTVFQSLSELTPSQHDNSHPQSAERRKQHTCNQTKPFTICAQKFCHQVYFYLSHVSPNSPIVHNGACIKQPLCRARQLSTIIKHEILSQRAQVQIPSPLTYYVEIRHLSLSVSSTIK